MQDFSFLCIDEKKIEMTKIVNTESTEIFLNIDGQRLSIKNPDFSSFSFLSFSNNADL